MVVAVNAAGGSTTVYRTNTGSCYHTSGCSYLKSKIECTLYDAVKVYGLRACSKCKPPQLDSQSTTPTTKVTTPPSVKSTTQQTAKDTTQPGTKSSATTPTTAPKKIETLPIESNIPIQSSQQTEYSDNVSKSPANQSVGFSPDTAMLGITVLFFGGILFLNLSSKKRLSEENEELSREVKRLSIENKTIRTECNANVEQVKLEAFQRKKEYEQKVRELEHALQNAKENAERDVYLKIYGGKSALECAGAPTDCYISPDGYPAQMGPKKYGNRFSVFVSASGKCYHSRKGCSNASIEVHYLQAKESGKVPCSICCPIPPDLSWYEKYNDIRRIKEKYHIF